MTGPRLSDEHKARVLQEHALRVREQNRSTHPDIDRRNLVDTGEGDYGLVLAPDSNRLIFNLGDGARQIVPKKHSI
jgi:hypothetical protein